MAGPSQKDLQKALEFKNKLTDIINAIHETQDIAEIIVNLRPKILDLLDAERLSIYAVDAKNQQVYSLFKQGEELKEIRVARNSSSMVGFVALTGQTLNIKNAYNAAELTAYHPELKFDSSWDAKSGFKTKQVLTTPVLYDKYLMGVLQLLNKVGGPGFTQDDVEAANQVAKTLGIAFYNRRRMAPKRNPNKFGALIDKNLISEKNFEDAVAYARMNNLVVSEVLVEKYRISKDEVLKSLAAFYECGSFIFDGSQRMPDEFRERLKHEYLKKICVAPVAKDGATVVVAMEDPSDLAKVDAVRVMQLAAKQQFVVALPKDINDYIDFSYNVAAAGSGQMADIVAELGADEDEASDEEAKANRQAAEDMDDAEPAIVRLANQIIIDGYQRGASDIHVEPYGKNAPCIVRFRIDGICHVYQEIPASSRSALVSRLKIMAHLDISERRLPQDGKIRFKMGAGQIELRVATLPTMSGGGGDEDVVMRILAASKPMPLEEMGFSERNLRVTKELMDKPYGIFLCVGPTGSGKTTTLHSALGYINTPELKIWTAEDPVEITQRGLRQVQMRPKINLTFANAMRAFLRADPDVIMVGEMRDKETAEIGIEASLTGHLVVSTLHTNSAPETVTRLLDMEIEPFNFADSLLGILAQRLARRLCKHCKQAFHPSEEEFNLLVNDYDPKYFPQAGITYKPDMTLYRAVGCPECAGTGYRGRIALHELMVGTDPIKRMIQKRAPVEDIRTQAMADGMTTLMQDGVVKIFSGATDRLQVRSVCIK